MITIRMESGVSYKELTHRHWDVGIIGDIVDDRGKAAVVETAATTDRVVYMTYDPVNLTMTVDGVEIAADDLEEEIGHISGSSVMLDATTLGLPEILLSVKALRNRGISELSILYIEPGAYSGARKTHVMHKRDFELSDDSEGYLGVPGFTVSLNSNARSKIVFFLGYEGQRLERAFEQFENLIRPVDCTTVMGVPAFRPGWEMDTFANNVRVLADRGVGGGVLFCGAENPASVVSLLEEFYRTMNRGEEQLFVGPIGTKPHGIGAALFACENPDIGVLYDHPRRKDKRSTGTGTWHLFEVSFA